MIDATQADGIEGATERRRQNPRHPTSVRVDHGQLGMSFEGEALSRPTREILGLVHGNDPIESQVAAIRALPGINELQQRILAYIVAHGPHTALELEDLPEFRDAGQYNVRRRCSGLCKMDPPLLVRVGRRGTAGLLDIPKAL